MAVLQCAGQVRMAWTQAGNRLRLVAFLSGGHLGGPVRVVLVLEHEGDRAADGHPPRTPLTIFATSVSILCRPPRPWPPCRRARSRRRSSSEISSPAGKPSMITVSCGPCDSPAVSHLSIEAMIGAV